MSRRFAALLPLPVLAALPRAAEACAVCMSGRADDTQRALLAGTLLLSTLPLVLIGGIVWYIRRRAREHASAAARRSQPAT